MRTSGAVVIPLIAALGCVGPLSQDTSELSSPTYPFGARIDPYRYGIKPNHLSAATMDATIRSHYDAWKLARIVNVPSVSGGKAVKFNNASYLTVSEGMGYGMLLTVLMAGHDADAQTIFDGLLKTVRARPAYSVPASSGGPYLMDWRLAADGSSTDAAGGGWNAMDGDLDIAMALLMADRQWGSSGAWNYKQEAIRTINAMKAWNMTANGTPIAKGPDVSRTSDYMIGHFRAFAAATGDSFWTTAIDRTYSLINRMQTVYSPVGLMPDFIVGIETSAPYPSPGGRIESPWEGQYFANGQRNPWRWGTDYVFSGDARWKGVLTKMMNFFVADTGGTPGPPVSSWGAPNFFGNVPIGYHLDGSHMTPSELGASGPWPAIGIVAGAMNGAQSDAMYQSFLNASWDWLEAKWTTNYYDSELTLLSMIVASGNWWNPGSGSSPPPPPPSSSGSKSQAEATTLSGTGVSVHNDLAGFEDSGFVGSFTANGDRMTATFTNVTAGSYQLRIRYHAWTAQQNYVVINGATRDESFPSTGSAWVTKTIAVTLTAGTNTVAIVKNWGYIDVDYVEIVSSGGTAVTIRTQAENGTRTGSGVSVRTDLAGYEGSGFVGSFTVTGDTLAVNFPNVVAGTYTLRIRYHAWTQQQNDLSINGAWRSQAYAATGSGWAVLAITGVALPAGTSTITIRKDWGYTDVDWIEIAPQ